MRIAPISFRLFGLAIFIAGVAIEPAAAAAISPGIPCSGLWKINEQATMRTTTAAGPTLQFYEPWGKNGWMRMNTSAPETATFGEWHFEQFNEQTYQVFGTDPSLAKARKINAQMVEASRVRLGEDANSQLVIFAEDCSRVTMYKAEGEDRHAPPGKTHYYNDLRVYDKIMPPKGAPTANVAAEFFGGWELNRAASKLTTGPKEAETVVLVPWEKSGWIWNQLSGGPYQPEGVHKAVKRVECGAATGAAAIACQGPAPSMMLYWATWDAKPFATYGARRTEVRLKMINARSLEVAAANGNTSAVALSADGKRMTVTTKSGAAGANGFADDIRVYDRIDGDTWPTVKP